MIANSSEEPESPPPHGAPSGERLVPRSAPAAILAVAASLVVVTRACIQSITIDEADSYLGYASTPAPSHWMAAANNHVLNSAVMRLCTMVFGPSHLSIRGPAVLGAFLYIACAYYLARLIGANPTVNVPLLICLVYNPFVLDHLVAARGYGLATAFLLAAILVWVRSQYAVRGERPDLAAAGLCSCCAGLSFSANFSFAFVDAMALVCMAAHAIAGISKGRRLSVGHISRVTIAYIVPAAAVVALIPLSTVLSWPKGQLVYGAMSLAETFRTVAQCSLYRPNPFVASPLIYSALMWMQHLILPVLGIAAICQCISIWWDRALLSQRPAGKMALRVALMLAVILMVSLGAHRLAYRLSRLPMPKERTALFIVPLLTLAAGCLGAVRLPGRLSRFCSGFLRVALALTAFYFLGCLRLTYFQEWYWNSDTKQVYDVLAYFNHEYAVREVPVTWKCVSALNTYRAMSGHESLEEFSSVPGKYPRGRDVYVVDLATDQRVIDENRLKVVYRGEVSEIGVAINPARFDDPASGRKSSAVGR